MLTLFPARSQLDDVAKARPEITKAVENMVKKGKWTVPGYTESQYTQIKRYNQAPIADSLFGGRRARFQSSE